MKTQQRRLKNSAYPYVREQSFIDTLSSQTEMKIVEGDVAQSETAKHAIKKTIDTLGQLDCLVNNVDSGKWAVIGAPPNFCARRRC